jgi:23S rRNA (pseudouridine1915-N3)-methyltransferase
MHVVVAAVGRLKQGPERELAERYRKRAVQAGRSVGLREIEIVEVKESRAQETEKRVTEESIAIASLIPEGAVVAILDERAENLNSTEFAGLLQRWQQEGRTPVFVIGGPDGLAPALRAKADVKLAFGSTTWPHQLVRIMLLEQLYRAVTILSGHPYHRP